MALFALGLNHATAPIEVRERVAFPQEGLRDALRDTDCSSTLAPIRMRRPILHTAGRSAG